MDNMMRFISSDEGLEIDSPSRGRKLKYDPRNGNMDNF